MCNVLVCATGSVAAIRVPQLATELCADSAVTAVRVVSTSAAQHFVEREARLPQHERLLHGHPPRAPDPAHPHATLCDADEWDSWTALGDQVLHIELRNWADVLVVAPLSANTLAKLANGLCDNLVTCVARAWPLPGSSGTARRKPFIVAPAMNTAMWDHPLTRAHLDVLQHPSMAVRVVAPVEKRLACGDVGVGAMAPPHEIVAVVRAEIQRYMNPTPPAPAPHVRVE